NTHLVIDSELLNEALQFSGLKSKKETVNAALREFINSRKQLEVIESFGKFDPDPDYDYKQGRKP
ncbi:type II toxin-antitoxin system VapB family antitoxin, partial [Methylovulum psychrotolerans]|uniref:type II toxin-antitoxin system VapB family antitoxin n=1 Tax=Methylovulum psychrotolerans TaxID=1704499 RepID=UPI000CDF1FB0